MTTWTPTPEDLRWCAGLLRATAHGATWGTTNGIYTIDHTHKCLTLVAKPPWFNPVNHEKNVIAFGRLGYAVAVDVEE